MRPAPVPTAAALDALQRDFEAIDARLANGPQAWTVVHRRAAFARFLDLGFPTTRVESWRATPLGALATTAFAPRPAAPAAHEAEGHRVHTPWVVIANGHWVGDARPDAALPAGVRVLPFATALAEMRERLEPLVAGPWSEETHPFRLLNAALAEDGVVVVVPKGVVVSEPLTLPFVTLDAPVVSHPRAVILLEEGAQATIAEVHSAPKGHPWCNALTDVVLAPGASLEHVRVVESNAEAFHLGSVRVRQARGSRLASRVVTLGGAISRTEVDVALADEGAECELDGLWVGAGAQHLDHETAIDHAAPRCSSRQLYKGILGGRAKGVFHGTIVVRQDAQATDARQSNRNLLLSSEAVVDTKPTLEIHANDVKCTHGATIGRIDPLQLFYLRSRGLDESVARQALVHAFAGEILGRVRHAPLRQHLDDAVRAAVAALVEEART